MRSKWDQMHRAAIVASATCCTSLQTDRSSLPRTNAADLDAGAGQGAQRGLGAGAGGLGAVAAGGAQLDVQRVHAQLLQQWEGGGREGVVKLGVRVGHGE